MKKITISLDEKTAAWVRLAAAKRRKSVSRFLAERLHQRTHDAHNYNEAMLRFLGKVPVVLNSESTGYGVRDQLHDRKGLR